MSMHSLKAARHGVASVRVDDIVLLPGGPAVELTDDQITRLMAIDGVELSDAPSLSSPAPADPAAADTSPVPGGSPAPTNPKD